MSFVAGESESCCWWYFVAAHLSGVSLPHWFSGSLWSVSFYFVFLWVNLIWSRDSNSVETARAVCTHLRQLQTWLLREVKLKEKQVYVQRWAGRCTPLLSCPHPPRCGKEDCWWGIMFSELHWTTFSVGKNVKKCESSCFWRYRVNCHFSLF